MEGPTKIAFVADSQLGKRLYGLNDTYNDWLKAFEYCGEHISQSKNVAAAIFLGDTFDAEAMYPKEIKTAQCTIAKIRSAGIPVYGILGNHDKGQSDINQITSWLDVCDITPLHPNKPILLANTNIIGINHQNKQLLADTLEQLCQPNGETILCLHQALKELSLPGQGWEVETSQVPEWISRVFLGDFHNRCAFKDKLGREFAYPGAIETVSFNQETIPGFIYYDTKTKETEHISTKQREYLKIDTDKLPSNWEVELTKRIEQAQKTFNTKPVIQLISKGACREDMRIFCESLALKVVSTEIAITGIEESEVASAPTTREEVKKLASEYLPNTELGDLARLLLEKPEEETLRGWQKKKYPNATIN